MSESSGPNSWRPVIGMIAAALSVGLGAGTQLPIPSLDGSADQVRRMELAVDRMESQMDEFLRDKRKMVRAVLLYQMEIDRYMQMICTPNCPPRPAEMDEAASEARSILRK